MLYVKVVGIAYINDVLTKENLQILMNVEKKLKKLEDIYKY